MKASLVAVAMVACQLPAAALAQHHPQPHRTQEPSVTGTAAARETARGDVAAPLYTSALERYGAFAPDEKATDWRAANDRVREVGGHAGLGKAAAAAAGTAKDHAVGGR